MTAPVRKYNPGFLTDAELMASFCVRTAEFDSTVEMLRGCTGPSNQHQIVIGPRGSGKTSLLLRVAAEIRRDPELSRSFFPVVFAEESYEVASVGEFWLEALSRLALAPARGNAPDLHRTLEDLRTIQDDQTLGDRCLGALLDFSDREGKRLALMVENLNMIFRDMSDRDAGWRLRKILQTEPRIILLASATRRFAEIDHPDHALYDLFRVRTLSPLDTKECAVLWETVSGAHPPRQTIRPLEILTGGSPRLIAIVARFGEGRSFRELMDDLLDLVDEHTEYFRSHIEALPAQERRVYLALADLWKPATTREVADRSRVDTSKCSAQLTRLTERGVVQVTGGTLRRKQYYLTERLYNIYYLLRRNRGPDSLVQGLIKFMESLYSPSELRDFGERLAHEAHALDGKMRSLHRTALQRLAQLPRLAGHQEDLLALLPEDEPEELAAAGALFDRALALEEQDRPEEALDAYDEILRRFGEDERPALLGLLAKALDRKGALVVQSRLLGGVNPEEYALAATAEAIERWGRGVAPTLTDLLPTPAKTGSAMDAIQGALNFCDDVVRRFGKREIPILAKPVAMGLVMKAALLTGLNRPEDAVATFDEFMRRFGDSEVPIPPELVAMALAGKASVLLTALKQPRPALAAFDEVLRRFGEDESLMIRPLVVESLLTKAALLDRLNCPDEALAALDEVLDRFRTSQSTIILRSVAEGLLAKAVILGRLNRLDETLDPLDELLRRFGESRIPTTPQLVAMALYYKGITLRRLGRMEEALAACNEVLRRSGRNDLPAWVTEGALLEKAGIELKLRSYESASETVGRLLDQCSPDSLDSRWRGHLIRARVALAKDDRIRCEREIEAILAILPELDSLPTEVVDALVDFTIGVGAACIEGIIQASPSAKLLLPMTTALEQELGRETRVANEVEEVAQDIRQKLARRRKGE